MNRKFVAINRDTDERIFFEEWHFKNCNLLCLLTPGEWDIRLKWRVDFQDNVEKFKQTALSLASNLMDRLRDSGFLPAAKELYKTLKEYEVEPKRIHYGQYAIETEGFDVLGTIDTTEEFDEDEDLIRVKAELVIEGETVKTMEWKREANEVN